MQNTARKGFTLIEMMVVLSLISLLSAVILGAVNSARIKARDTQRIQALEEIRKALTLYYHDHGYYPPASGYFSSNSNWLTFEAAMQDLSGQKYLPSLPKDPVNKPAPNYNFIFNANSVYYNYGYRSNPTSGQPQDYDLIARFETSNPLNCTNKQWISHAGTNTSNADAGKVWCAAAPAGIGGTGNLYSLNGK